MKQISPLPPSPFGALTAQHLLDIGAVHLRPDQPFTLTSGRQSPTYVDCRKVISFPNARTALMDMAVECLESAIGWDQIDVLAGGETAGIPFAAFLAQKTGKPMVYVRKKPKGFGRGSQIEGAFEPGARVVLIEDLATDGGSKMTFVKALREAGADCRHTFVLFFYAIIAGALEALAKENLSLHHLASWHDIIGEVERTGALDSAGLSSVRRFLADPTRWSPDAAHIP